MNIEFKISKKPVNYKKAMDFLQKRVTSVNKGGAELVWFLEHPTTFTAGVRHNKNEIIEKALKTKEAGTQNTILILNQVAIAIYENKIEIAKEKCKKAKSRTPNFDLENNLKIISDTVDKNFYNNFLAAVKSACD